GISLDAELYRDASPAAVIDTLAQRLKSTGRVSAAHAEMAARLVLMRRAPQFLVKDLPPSVRTHTQAWANLCIAVAAVEAQTPGRTVNMNFAEIMCANAPEHAESEAVKKAALIGWAVANDEICRFPDEVYTSEVLDTLRRSFNKQHEALKEAAGLLDIPLPNRSQMAEELIKQTFGADAPLDEKIFRIDYHKMKIIGPRYSELHSMREITMLGLKVDSAYWELNSPRNDINLAAVADFTQSSQFNLPATFENRFTEATSQCKKIHHYAWMNAITGLSTADRAILNDAKLSFYKENTYRISTLPLVPNALFHTSPTLLMQAEYKGEKHFYEFDTTTATIKKVPLTHIKPDEYISDEVTKIEKIQLDRRQELLETEETRGSKSSNTFTNPRIRAIAQVIVNAQGIDSDAVKCRAQGRTPAESRADKLKVVGEFILDLIPLRSAIVNWRSGNYKDAAVDLAFDVFGFLTAGVGTVAKLAKGARKAGSTVSKVARASRIIGADTLSAFNPLGGLGDVAVGAGKLALTGVGAAREGIQRLRSMATGSELATASTRFDGAATGTFKAGDKVVMGDAVKYDDKWYALDANSLQPCGPPLEDFNYIDTLTPPVRSSNTHATHRVHPYQNRPDQPHVGATKQQLPAGDYAESTKGKLVPGHFIPGNGMDETKALFTQQMEDVMAAAKAPGGLPTPPTLPAEIKPTTPQNLIVDAFKVSQGLVFGENHKQMASFKLLWDNIQTFKAEGVKKVYFEGVIDLPPFGIVDDGIGNLGALKNGRTKPTFKELKVEFEKNGIEVSPLDHYYLTRHKDTRIRGQSIIPGVNSEIRLKEFNYFASETIQANSGTEKWIALVGQAHMNTSEGVPGLAELTGTLGIGIYEHPMVSANVGLKAKRHIPDPTQVLKHRDRPGNLHIYMKP
ncbi:membrane-targeted effector domain-containing toxin, partial [Pseudomonas salomonii]